MLRLPFLVALALLTAFGLGIGSAVGMLDASSGFGAIRLGPWAAFPEAQTAGADPYARAHRARAGKLLYAAAEGLQFQAEDDDEGNKLSPRCTYAMDGLTPPARFWTLYAADRSLKELPGEGRRHPAAQSLAILRNADNSFVVSVGPDAMPGNWLAVSGRGPMVFVLTLYDTPLSGNIGIDNITLPQVLRVGCRG